MHGVNGPELPRQGVRAGGKIEIAHGSEADPYAQALRQRRQRVAINARIDTLEYEARRGRLTQGAYEAGRYIDALLERASGRRTGREFGEANRANVSSFTLQHALAARIDAARAAQALKDAMAREIGASEARVVVKVIGEGLSFREVARLDAMARGKNVEPVRTKKGRDCERAARKIAQQFRDALEALAAAWEKRSRPV
jgi:hypothetical protein